MINQLHNTRNSLASVSDILMAVLGAIDESVDLLLSLFRVHFVIDSLTEVSGLLIAVDRNGALFFQLVMDDGFGQRKVRLLIGPTMGVGKEKKIPFAYRRGGRNFVFIEGHPSAACPRYPRNSIRSNDIFFVTVGWSVGPLVLSSVGSIMLCIYPVKSYLNRHNSHAHPFAT